MRPLKICRRRLESIKVTKVVNKKAVSSSRLTVRKQKKRVRISDFVTPVGIARRNVLEERRVRAGTLEKISSDKYRMVPQYTMLSR